MRDQLYKGLIMLGVKTKQDIWDIVDDPLQPLASLGGDSLSHYIDADFLKRLIETRDHTEHSVEDSKKKNQ